MSYRISVMALLAATITGCMTAAIPMNAGEFRDAFKEESRYARHESYEVAVALGDITKNFQRYAPKCLDATVKSSGTTASGRVSTHSYHYKATVLAGKERTELHVQSYHAGDEVFIKMPKDGLYTLVADATKVSSKKSRIDLYYSTINGEPIAKAVKNWTHNKNLGCPDLTQ